MYLFSLIVLFVLVGWVLATTRYSRKVDDVIDRINQSIGRFGEKMGLQQINPYAPGGRENEFRGWALGPAAKLFPDEFKTWLAALSADEARRFHHSLAEYSNSLGFDLAELVDGGLDHDPRMRQVFVEAIVVYSPAYRKARQAKKTAAAEAKLKNGNGAQPEIRPAEKSTGRRNQPAVESTETASAA